MRKARYRTDEHTERTHDQLNRAWREAATGRTLVQLPRPRPVRRSKQQLALFHTSQ